MKVWCFVLLAIGLAVGCSRAPRDEARPSPRAAEPAGRAPAAAEYDIRGTVTAIDRERGVVTLDHEEIPGFMAAMTMAYPVADPKAHAGLAVGDKVEGRLEARDGEYRLLSLRKR